MKSQTFNRLQASFIAKIEFVSTDDTNANSGSPTGTITVHNHPDKNGHTTITAYDGTEELYDQFANAPSVGKFWHAFIKPLAGRKIS